jgi:predicted metal-dependent HD superfamily phosphohydrolase
MSRTAAYQENLSSLRDRFMALWNRICGRAAREDLFERLVLAYSQPHRFYHTLYHVNQSLQELDNVRKQAEHPDLVELAIWFHDSIYDPPGTAPERPDNEQRSAEWAETELRACLVPAETISTVRDLILATRHDAAPRSRDAMLLSDIDLAIFGKPRPLFDDYERSIRLERSYMQEQAYRAARIRGMERFLRQEHMYHTTWFQQRYEAAARENLTRLIGELSGKLPGRQVRQW